MSIQQEIEAVIEAAFQDLYEAQPAEVNLEKTNPKFEGDLTFVVFPHLRLSRKKPEDTAEELGTYLLKKVEAISDYNVVKGFLNLVLSDAYWTDYFLSLGSDPQIPDLAMGQKVVVEYSSPNTNKPLHLGHIRNNVLGASICNILEANGYAVTRTNLVNDRGIHICKSMLAWQRFGNGETPESSGLKGDHLVGKYYVRFDQEYKKEQTQLQAAGMNDEEAEKASELMQAARQLLLDWEQNVPEVRTLWQKMNGWVYDGFEQTYAKLGIHFDRIYYESETYLPGKDMVQDGLAKGVFYQKPDGSIWVDLTDEGLDHKLLLRADGTSVYMTQDLGTARLRYQDYRMDRSIYVVGNEQDYHFKVLRLILKKLGEPFWEGIEHLSYGMVDLPSGKMKSREGTVVDADDLVSEMVQTARRQTEELGKTDGMDEGQLDSLYQLLGLGALKYFLLRVDARNRMLFDPQESIDFQGNTGPFIQYTHTRIASILRVADVSGSARPASLNSDERELIQLLHAYPQRVNEAAQQANPSVIAQACFELAKSYNRFYHAHSILGAEDPVLRHFRIRLSERCGDFLRHGFALLGIGMPERM